MKRSSPMRRTAWVRKPPRERVDNSAASLDGHEVSATKKVAPLRRGTYAGETTAPAPKTVQHRNRALLDLAQGRRCLLMVLGVCCFDTATTVACHSNWSVHGKAGARKADDHYSCWGCHTCHRWLDQAGVPEPEKRAVFDLGMQRQAQAWEQIRSGRGGAKSSEVKAAAWALDRLKADGFVMADQQKDSRITGATAICV